NLKNLLAGLSVAVSWDSKDTDANDRMLRKVKAELPSYVANLLLFSLDGTNIGTSSEMGRPSVGDRDYFLQVIAGHDRAVGRVIRSRTSGGWVITIARPVVDSQ